MVNREIVDVYLEQLENCLGDDSKFLTLYGILEADRDVGQQEAVLIANAFVAPSPKSTPRAKALERILHRHSSLVSFKLKRRAMAGRSAA